MIGPVPHGHRRWVVPALVALAVVAFLALRRKGGGAAGIAQQAGQSPAEDPYQKAAQDLTLQAQQQAAQYQNALDGIAAQSQGANAQIGYFKAEIANPVVACPGGGLPRLVPDPSSWTGFSPSCIEHKSGGVTLGSVLGAAQAAFGDYVAFGRSARQPARAPVPVAPSGGYWT